MRDIGYGGEYYRRCILLKGLLCSGSKTRKNTTIVQVSTKKNCSGAGGPIRPAVLIRQPIGHYAASHRLPGSAFPARPPRPHTASSPESIFVSPSLSRATCAAI